MNEHLHPIFKDLLNGLANNEIWQVQELVVKKWKHTDRYPCPSCGNKLALPDYQCFGCKIKLKIKVAFP